MIKTWWTFTRPHTIIGSFVSVTALYLIACAEAASWRTNTSASTLVSTYYFTWLLTILCALCCNIFITGLNQIEDVELDKINKPWLPLAAGTLNLQTAKIAVVIALLSSLLIAWYVSIYLFILIASICLIGSAYSLPPLKFKRHHVPAAIAIVSVRGLLVNLGMAAHFMEELTDVLVIPASVWPLALFVVAFSLGIAWFKDIPDTAGDEAHAVKTLAVQLNRKKALWLGVTVVAFGYVLLAAAPLFWPMPVNQTFFCLLHIALLLLFISNAARLDVSNQAAIKKFYMFYWGLFFAEYIIYPLAYYLQ